MPDHLHTQHGRAQEAAEALLAARVEYAQLPRTHPSVPRLYATAVLAADDAHGRAGGLVVQGDGIERGVLPGLWKLALAAAEQHNSGEHRGFHGDCPTCVLIWSTVRRVEVADLVEEIDAEP
jgi:hypothetical protein